MRKNIKRWLTIGWLAGFLWGCSVSGVKTSSIQNPVLPGDLPNPSIIKIDDTYYATATSNEWSPLFPVFKSTDLNNWQLISYVFPGGAPDWAVNNFWAPELSYDERQKKLYAYYTARNKQNQHTEIGVAIADTPEGPFTDCGPLFEVKTGAIDPYEIRDENGTLYLVWKDEYEPGAPAIIWAQQLKEDRSELIGEQHELIRNDVEWEEHTVEGPCIYQKDDYFYLFYSAGNCCDTSCNYKIGVARAKTLLGEWEKFEGNPILADNMYWKCPGTGTVFEFEDDDYLLLHAYRTDGGDFIGREGIIRKLNWTVDDWPYFESNMHCGASSDKIDFVDRFTDALSLSWQWRSTQQLSYATGDDGLMLASSYENFNMGSLLVQPVKSTDFELIASIDLSKTGDDAFGGIALIGASSNVYGASAAGLGISTGKDLVEVWRTVDREVNILEAVPVPEKNDLVVLKMRLCDGHRLQFSLKQGDHWQAIADSIDAAAFVPWGMGFRLGIVATGPADEFVNFREIKLSNF